MMRPDGQLNDLMHLRLTTRHYHDCIADRRRSYNCWIATATFMGMSVVNCLALAMRKDDDKDPVNKGLLGERHAKSMILGGRRLEGTWCWQRY